MPAQAEYQDPLSGDLTRRPQGSGVPNTNAGIEYMPQNFQTHTLSQQRTMNTAIRGQEGLAGGWNSGMPGQTGGMPNSIMDSISNRTQFLRSLAVTRAQNAQKTSDNAARVQEFNKQWGALTPYQQSSYGPPGTQSSIKVVGTDGVTRSESGPANSDAIARDNAQQSFMNSPQGKGIKGQITYTPMDAHLLGLDPPPEPNLKPNEQLAREKFLYQQQQDSRKAGASAISGVSKAIGNVVGGIGSAIKFGMGEYDKSQQRSIQQQNADTSAQRAKDSAATAKQKADANTARAKGMTNKPAKPEPTGVKDPNFLKANEEYMAHVRTGQTEGLTPPDPNKSETWGRFKPAPKPATAAPSTPVDAPAGISGKWEDHKDGTASWTAPQGTYKLKMTNGEWVFNDGQKFHAVQDFSKIKPDIPAPAAAPQTSQAGAVPGGLNNDKGWVAQSDGTYIHPAFPGKKFKDTGTALREIQ